MLVQSQSSLHKPSSHLRKIQMQISLQRSKLDQGILLDYGIPGHQKKHTQEINGDDETEERTNQTNQQLMNDLLIHLGP